MFEEMKIRHLLGFTLLVSIVTITFLVLLSASEPIVDITLQLIIYVIVPVLFFRYHFKKQQMSVKDVVFVKDVKRLIPSILGLVVLSIAFSLSVFWFQLFALMPFAPGLVDFFLEALPMPENPWYLAFTIISIAIIAPIAEEFIFRGVLLKRMIAKTSMWTGIVISSVLFGILHADIIGAFIFGVVASLLYIKTNNLFVPILLHLFNNSIAMIWTFIAPTWPSWAVMENSDIYTEALPNTIVLVISSILMGRVVLRLARGVKEKQVI
ncbi:CPBP family intramembrane glutamic endopeptidase [Paenisporosarcina indica]|uniref:CPBP family intramembrane glutamic endopeptidase n=1 Tax=Paenisporosarcina indica TaxID=650093 RepID=UPI00094F6223|nr:type II CAAX endopeptidase family protein [Paenisporosarcina indica]